MLTNLQKKEIYIFSLLQSGHAFRFPRVSQQWLHGRGGSTDNGRAIGDNITPRKDYRKPLSDIIAPRHCQPLLISLPCNPGMVDTEETT